MPVEALQLSKDRVGFIAVDFADVANQVGAKMFRCQETILRGNFQIDSIAFLAIISKRLETWLQTSGPKGRTTVYVVAVLGSYTDEEIRILKSQSEISWYW